MTTGRLLSRRDAVIWAVAFVLVALVIATTKFASDDPDSALYASLSGRLAQEPPSRWIAPEWWGFWPDAQMTGLFREHPAGVLLLPAALTRVGIPAEQGAYVVGVAAGLASLLLIAALLRLIVPREDARVALVLLQLMPVAFIFRVRANHEYPMLLALLVTIWGVTIARRSWHGVWLAALGVTAGALIKGVFVAIVLIGAVLWIVLNPTLERDRSIRQWIAITAALVAMLCAVIAYDAWYFRVTGETFWLPYWRRQLGPVTIASPLEDARSLLGHVLFYVTRLLWHPLPWSFTFAALLWRRRGIPWRTLAGDRTARGALFVLAFAAASVLLLSPSSRFAERYAFSATYAVAAGGVVAASVIWPGLKHAIAGLDRRIPALPALVWLGLLLLRLVGGPLLPRI